MIMKSKFQLPLLIILLTLFFAACTTAATETKTVDIEKIKPTIQAMEDAFAAAEKAKDAAAVAVYYAEDATSYPRGKAPKMGNAAIKEDIAKNIAEDTSGNYNVYKVVDLFGEGNMLVEIGSWTKMNAAGTAVDNGHYMSYFENRNGKYVCVRDMSVASNPTK